MARKEKDLDRELIISKRTFNRDLAEINEFFGISIKFDFKSGQYAIDTEGSSKQNIQLLEVFDTLQLFGKRGKVPPYVFMEQRAAKGTEYFSTIINAIEHSKKIQITYGKYWKWETEERILKPLGLKEFKQRWYLLAYDENNQFKVFALDRVHEISLTKERCKVNRKIDFEAYFRDLFGVINKTDNPVEEVVLTFPEFKGRYIKSLLLHTSQEILVDDDKILTIRLRVKIEYELIAEILFDGDEVRVDAPERLKEIIRKKAGNIVYEKV